MKKKKEKFNHLKFPSFYNEFPNFPKTKTSRALRIIDPRILFEKKTKKGVILVREERIEEEESA